MKNHKIAWFSHLERIEDSRLPRGQATWSQKCWTATMKMVHLTGSDAYSVKCR